MCGPLSGLMVLDFSTLLPGPLATLMLVEAGAEVIKIERPDIGEDMRSTERIWDGESLAFAMLNRGKKSLALDLKSNEAAAVLAPLIAKADIIVEQFRPGVMERLGLGYEAIKRKNPSIIYCSITGYGQVGPKSQMAGHDLNYMGDSGVLSTSIGPTDQPVVPPALVADVGGGTYPAVVNILLALRERDKTGKGCHLDIAMSDGAFAFSFWAFAKGTALRTPIENNGEWLTGGTARYQLYPTADGRHVAVGALEQKFWDRFCKAINLEKDLCNDSIDPAKTIAAVGKILKMRSADEWEPVLVKADCCCTIVRTMDEVLDDTHFNARGIFDWKVQGVQGAIAPALPIPVAPLFRGSPDILVSAPCLGSDDDQLK